VRWLAANPPDLAEARVAAERMARDANRASEVVSRIRGLLRRDESRIPLDVNGLVREVIDLMRRDVQVPPSVLHFEPAPTLPPIVADRVQLQQVLLNLVTNGLDAMADVPAANRTLMISTAAGANEIEVSIRDSGRGLDPELRERMFEAFHTTKPLGMGMGLTISRSIVESHGGRLWAMANPEGGETFRFTLPIEDATA
jgi:signal transduction histidine kinase